MGHSIIHHKYSNDENDTITNADMPRDNWVSYVSYAPRWLLYSLNVTTFTHFVAQGNWKYARLTAFGSAWCAAPRRRSPKPKRTPARSPTLNRRPTPSPALARSAPFVPNCSKFVTVTAALARNMALLPPLHPPLLLPLPDPCPCPLTRYIGFVWLVARCFGRTFVSAYVIYPLMEQVMLLMMANWSWHAFIDPTDATNENVLSTTILNGQINVRTTHRAPGPEHT